MPANPPPTLEQLYLDFLATGNEATLEQWMRRSSPTLRSQALRLGACAADADDLVQETFVAAIQGADRYDASRPLLPWLKGILTFRAARLARNEMRRRHHYELRQQQHISPGANDAMAAIEVDKVPAELDHDVRRAIDDLPERYREPLLQYLLAERSPVEIATSLGVERATVRVRLHRGLRRLRDALQRWALLFGALLLGRRASAATGATALVVFAVVALGAWLLQSSSPAAEALATQSAVQHIARVEIVEEANMQIASALREPADVRMVPGEVIRPSVAAVTVTVRDASGAPMPRVGVTIEPQSGRDPVLHRRGQVTNLIGQVRWSGLAAGNWTVRIDRGQEEALLLGAGSNDHVFAVTTNRRTTGVVIDGAGQPVADAHIWLSSDRTGPWRGQDVARSNADGRFELVAVPEGAFLAARHERLGRSAVHRVGPHVLRSGQPDGPALDGTVQLQLGPAGGRTRVRVTTADGESIVGAAVHCGDSMDADPLWLAQGAAPWRAPPFVARTDATGTVQTAALEPGQHPVFVRANGQAPHRGVLEVQAHVDGVHVIRLAAGARVEGSVQNAQGQAIASALIAFRHPQSCNDVDLLTDASGCFTLDCVPLGASDVFAKSPGHEANAQSVVLTSTQMRRVVLVLPKSVTCHGKLSIGGQPPPLGTQVRTQWPAHALRDRAIVTATNQAGEFLFTGRDHERPQMFVRIADEPLWRDVSALTSWTGANMEVQLPDGFVANSWIRGKCTSDDGVPIHNARVYVWRNQKRWHEVGRTNAQGQYRIGPLPADSYSLFAESTDNKLPTVAGSTFLLEANTEAVSNLRAAMTGEVQVMLTRDDGQPVRDVLMTVQRSDLARRFAISNRADLRQHLEAGDYVLSIMGSSVQWIDAHAFTVQPGATTRVPVRLRAGSKCTLVPQGMPERAHDDVTIVHLHAISGPAWRSTVTLLPGAPLRIGAVLPPGSYAIAHTTSSGDHWSGTVSIASEHDARMPLLVPMHRVDTRQAR